MKYEIKWVIPLICILPIVQECAWKPSPEIPKDVTVQQLLVVVKKHSLQIKDFSASAVITAKLKGKPQHNARISIKYIRPNRFRVIVKGFAGVPVAYISTINDSMNIYLPNDNVYIKARSEDNVLQSLIPEFTLDINRITSVISGTLPSADELAFYQKSVWHDSKRAVLSLKSDSLVYRYTLAGAELRVIDEDILSGDKIIWSKKNSNFRNTDGVDFPRNIIVNNDKGTVDITFYSCSFNSGLTDNDLSFVIPPSAKKVYIENAQKN